MLQWPPSPIVEDEATALAKEYDLDNTKEKLADDQQIPSRGSPDQTPVIVDSDADTAPPTKATGKCSEKVMAAKREGQPDCAAMFQSETELPTPPPSDGEMRGRPRLNNAKEGLAGQTNVRKSRSAVVEAESRQARPSAFRLQTDIPGQTVKTKAGSRRAPSPYSYTRESGTFKIDPSTRYAADTFLSPTSPVSSSNHIHTQDKIHQSQEYYSSTDSEQRSKKSIRFAERNKALDHPLHNSQNENHAAYAAQAVPQSIVAEGNRSDRVQHAESRVGVAGAQMQYGKGSSKTIRRPPLKTQDAPRTPLAEESAISERVRNTKKATSGGYPVRRRSSHRRERPQLREPLSHHTVTHDQAGVSDDDATRRVYRVRDEHRHMASPTLPNPQYQEDYFSKAFHDNALKTSRYTPRSSIDDTAVLSPLASPPRTPRGDKLRRQGYFESPSSSPQRTPYHSRSPSLEEIQIRELKAHSSLLSQATSTAAALAQRPSPPVSRSSSNAIETTFACSSNVLPTKARSRASSPQRDRIHRFDTYAYGEQAMPQVSYPPVPQSHRPSTRDGLPRIEVPLPQTVLQAQRSPSWTGNNTQYFAHATQSNGSLHTTTTTGNLPPIQLSMLPVMQRSYSANTTQEVTQRSSDFVLPPCPRSQPMQGLRDWSTLKDMSELDICPKCAHALSFTRFRSALLPSRDKGYDTHTVCALSRPWVRLAMIQCVKLNKSDLSLVRKSNVLPEGARACEGSRPDVRLWWKLVDPATDRAVPGFFACSACVGSLYQIFPDLPTQFTRDDLNQEKVCSLRQGSKHFTSYMSQLEQIDGKCRDRGKSRDRYMQPFVDLVRRITRYPECARDALLTNRSWHYMNELPEFAICEACYEEVVWPAREKPVARDISKTAKVIPQAASSLSSSNGTGTRPISCQLYSDKMRRLFAEVTAGRIPFETFRAKVKERQAAHDRLTEMNKMYEEDQRMGWDRRAEIEKNKAYWRSIE